MVGSMLLPEVPFPSIVPCFQVSLIKSCKVVEIRPIV